MILYFLLVTFKQTQNDTNTILVKNCTHLQYYVRQKYSGDLNTRLNLSAIQMPSYGPIFKPRSEYSDQGLKNKQLDDRTHICDLNTGPVH